ncbi:MAG: molybdopterin-guanine dinucleotide biosynthesis protein MobB [Methanomicrobiales archaeon]|nr:molybdopterin-guanine dinucleotide biosynthesis protein MobB [Methanomicrobiales archaeon]
MKVIPVAGLSGSGKTSFIRSLLPLLARYGPVGAVKHIGHHAIDVPEGKDTTVMFATGAQAVAGIDQEKTIITLRRTSVADALDILAGQGVAFAVVEGFKGSTWPKIIIGDLEAEGCLLRNPAPEEVIRSLDRFPDYITLGEILRELAAGCRGRGKPCATAASTVPVPANLAAGSLSSLDEALPEIVRSVEELPGIAGARAVIRHGALFGDTDELLLAVAAGSGEEAAAALQIAISRCREILKGHTPR